MCTWQDAGLDRNRANRSYVAAVNTWVTGKDMVTDQEFFELVECTGNI